MELPTFSNWMRQNKVNEGMFGFGSPKPVAPQQQQPQQQQPQPQQSKQQQLQQQYAKSGAIPDQDLADMINPFWQRLPQDYQQKLSQGGGYSSWADMMIGFHRHGQELTDKHAVHAAREVYAKMTTSDIDTGKPTVDIPQQSYNQAPPPARQIARPTRPTAGSLRR